MFSGTVLSDLNRQTYKDLNYDLYDSTLNGVIAAVRTNFHYLTFFSELKLLSLNSNNIAIMLKHIYADR